MELLPLVTVSVSSYNNGRFIERTLNSIFSQTYPNIELIIIEDCSTDNSVQIIEDWLSVHAERFNRVFFKKNEKNQGITIVANLMVDNAAGKYASIIASDDTLVEYKIAEQVEILEKGEYAVAYGDCDIIDEQDNPIGLRTYEQKRGIEFIAPSGNVFREIVKSMYFMSHAMLFNLPLLRETGFKFNDDNIAEDWDIQLCLARNYKFHGSNKIYAKYRNVEQSLSKAIYMSGKLHIGYISILNVLFRYYKHPLNDSGDRQAIRGTAIQFFWLLVSYPLCTVKDRLKYAFGMFKIAPNLKFFIFLVKSVIIYIFGIKPKSQAEIAVNA